MAWGGVWGGVWGGAVDAAVEEDELGRLWRPEDCDWAESEGWKAAAGEGGDWGGALPERALLGILEELSGRERASARAVCRSWWRAEALSWELLSDLAPRQTLPAFLGRPWLRFMSLEQLSGPGGLDHPSLRLLPSAERLRVLELGMGRGAEPPRLLSLRAGQVPALTERLSLGRLRRLGLRDCVIGDEELGLLAEAGPGLAEVELSLGLYIVDASPLAAARPLGLAHKARLLRRVPLDDALKAELSDTDVLLLHALRVFTRVRHIRFDHSYLHPN